MAVPSDNDELNSDDGPCIRVLLKQQNELLSDIHAVATSMRDAVKAVVTVAKFLGKAVSAVAVVGGLVAFYFLLRGRP